MLNTIFDEIWKKKFAFLGTFFLVFTLTYIILLALDYLPEPVTETDEVKSEVVEGTAMLEVESAEEENSETSEVETLESVVEVDPNNEDGSAIETLGNSVLPLRIHIEKLGKTVSVLNPTSRTIADLDTALLDGVVRHPDSATLGQDGNVFILGHSSYLPNVFNKNFQAFNGIQDLAWGDTIEVFAEGSVYQYRVEKVYRARAQDVTVPIAGSEKKLTLATCNSFGSVDDRYVVEAKQVSEKKL